MGPRGARPAQPARSIQAQPGAGPIEGLSPVSVRPRRGLGRADHDPEIDGMLRLLSYARNRARPVLAVAALLASARGGPIEESGSSPADSPWPAGRPIAVEVRGGRASFDIPEASRGSQTLVIVSCLATGRATFPVRLEARSTRAAGLPPGRGSARPARLPKLDVPPPLPSPPPTTATPPGERTFRLMVRDGDAADPSNYLAIAGRLRALGRRVQVYVDPSDLAAVDAATLRDLVTTFDDRIFPAAASRFGPARDVDGDGRFTVLLSSWLTRLHGGRVSVDGFFRGADLDLNLGAPFGNRCDMIYLSTGLKAGPHLRTVVAHEYTHAVTFSRKALPIEGRNTLATEEEGWLDEALAHLVEDAFDFSRSNIDYRVSAYLSQPERYRLVVDDYYAADLFRSHGNRGATYLFLRWCVDRHGPGLLDALIRSERRGVENLEAATGSTFADLFRRWTVALYLSGLDPASTTDGGYRSIDPRGEIEDWVLAGPRASIVTPGGPVDTWSAVGTSAHFAVVTGSATGRVAIGIEGPPGADLQVTAILLPAGLGRPDLAVRAATGPDGSVKVRARVSEQDGTPVRLGALSWEPLVPASDPHAPGFRRDGLDMLGIASAFGTSALPARGSLLSRPLRLAGVRPGDGPLVFKAVGTDPAGRRVAAWAVVEPPGRPRGLSCEDPEEP